MTRAPSQLRIRREIRIVAEALFYRSEPVPAERLDFLENEMVATLRSAGRRARALFVLCLFGLVILAPLWVWRLPPLGRLAVPLRIRALTRMEETPLVAPLVLAVKAALCIFYYEQQAVAHEVGAAPRCLLPVIVKGPEGL